MQLIGVGMGRLLYMEMLDPNHYKTLKDQKIILLKNEKRKEDKTSKERKLVLKVVGCEILICRIEPITTRELDKKLFKRL